MGEVSMKRKAQEKNEKITNPRTNHWKKMNRKQRRELTRKIQCQDLSLEVVHPDAAGIDIGNESHYVAVPTTRDSQPVRRFGCTTGELQAMAEWLKQCRIRTVAMQSTGDLPRFSWRPSSGLTAFDTLPACDPRNSVVL